MVRMPSGMRPEEAPESVAWRTEKAKKRFYFKREHDVHLYYLVLESHVFDDVKDDLVCDWRGNIVMNGGWQGIADGMNSRFGLSLRPVQAMNRMKLLESREDELNSLFEETMDYRDRLEAQAFRKKARDWFRPKDAPGAPEGS
jgi:hypothetical protein